MARSVVLTGRAWLRLTKASAQSSSKVKASAMTKPIKR